MAKTYEMTVHEALAELKVLAARIDKEINKATFVATNKHSNSKIDGKTIKEYEEGMKADLQSINDLIARRSAIKRAVVLSNAQTEITIKDDKRELKMTVAEAIEYKAVGIAEKQHLLDRITKQFLNAQYVLKSHVESIEKEANEHIRQTFGSKDNIDVKAMESVKKTYIDANTIDLIDPNKVEDVIKNLSAEIDFFNSKVDAAISVSNATTIITFAV